MAKSSFMVTPTIFFIREDNALKQVVTIETNHEVRENKGRVRVEMLDAAFEVDLNRASLYLGKYIVGIPEVSQPTPATFILTTSEGSERSCSATIHPSRHWQIYLIPHTHLDIGFTDLQDKVWEFQAQNLDRVISLCRETGDWPEGSRFMWTCEVSRLIKNYMDTRPAEKIQELVELIREGEN